jgi:hypothetical protein
MSIRNKNNEKKNIRYLIISLNYQYNIFQNTRYVLSSIKKISFWKNNNNLFNLFKILHKKYFYLKCLIYRYGRLITSFIIYK